MNRIILIGNIASDIEQRTTQKGITNCNFRIAVQRRVKSASGEYEADFLPVVAWRQTAEFISKYFIKGSKIALDGSVQTRSYKAQDGSKRYVTEVIAEHAEFVGKREGAATAENQPAADDHGFTEYTDDDLPF